MTLRPLLVSALAAALVLSASRACAQVHWDASAQIGVMKRNLVERPVGGARDATIGPAGQLTAHVALFPLVRVGAYFGHDISPFQGEASARDITWGGLRAKLMSPWPRGDLRGWLFFGFGYAGVYERSTPAAGLPGAGGSFFEVPFGLGASYKLRKPWEVCAELGGRVGFGHTGSIYEPVSEPRQTTWHGTDRFGVGLTVGVLVDL